MRTLSLLALLAGMLITRSASAQATNTWVSGVGDDTNPCSRTAPCSSFSGAYAKTATGGLIEALDPGSFGAITLTHAITLDMSAVGGGITAANAAITVNTGDTNAVITLRGISVVGSPSATHGINIVSAGAVHIEDCTINGFTNGINVQTSNPVAVFLRNVVIRNNTNGIALQAGSGVALDVQHGWVVNNPNGIWSQGFGTAGTDPATAVSLFDTGVSGSSGIGLYSAGNSVINMHGGVISDNGSGVQADNGTVRLSEVIFSHNGTAIVQSTGAVVSFGNNALSAGNANDGAFTGTLPLQ